MICLHRWSAKVAFVAAFFIASTPSFAQWQVPNHAVPIGRGAGTGFKSVGPGTSGIPLIGQGASADPAFGTATVPGGGTGATSFTANAPLIGNGSSAIAQGTRSGNTTVFGTTSGALGSGHCAQFDASGNIVDSGSSCATGLPAGTQGYKLGYDGSAWIALSSVPIDARLFGVKCDGVTNDQPAIQLAITAAQVAGGIVQMPPGQCVVNSTITITQPIIFQGVGMGAGPGAVSNTMNTQILANFSSGDVISYTSAYGGVFRDFQVNSNVGARGSGAGIHINGPNPTTNANSIISNVAFNSQYIDIETTYAVTSTINNTYHQGWGYCALVLGETGGGIEASSGNVYNNYLAGYTSTLTAQTCGMQIISGYAEIHGNTILGAQIGISITITQHDVGSIRIHHNAIEEQTVKGIQIANSGTYNGSMFDIDHNEFSSITNVASIQSIATVSGGLPWLTNLNINDNTFSSNLDANSYYINLQSGSNVKISNNLVNHNGSSSAIYMLFGAQLSTVMAQENQVLGTLSKYNNMSSNTLIVDHQGIPSATLGSAANGSQIYLTDGLTTGGTCSGGGSGTAAFRAGGAWKCF